MQALLSEDAGQPDISLRGVARRAQVSAPAIYLHFDSVTDMLLELTTEAFTDMTDRLTAARSTENNEATDRLRAVCQAYLDFADDHPERYRLMFNGLWSAEDGADPPAAVTAVAQLGQDTLDVLTAAVADVQAEDADADRPEGDAFRSATVIWLGLHGLAHQRAASPHFPWPTDIGHELIDRLAPPRP